MSHDKREKPLLDEARELATNYNKRATEFSERIKKFQSWLRRIEFRVRTRVEFELNQKPYRLSFTEISGKWGLYIGRKNRNGLWELVGDLESCSVEMKVAAAVAFPQLLEDLIVGQRQELASIDAAHKVMDDMAEKIGSFEEEAE